MNLNNIGIYAALFLCSHIAYGQREMMEKIPVLYDPLFWRAELKLDAFQTKKIKEINSEYYAVLITAFKQKGSNNKQLQMIAAQSLMHRSEQIWSTFHPRQRKKWKKIWVGHRSSFYPDGTSSARIEKPTPGTTS